MNIKSYEDYINATEPTGAYENTVHMITVDATRSDFKLYEQPFEWYEYEDAILTAKVNNTEKKIVSTKTLIDTKRINVDTNTERLEVLLKKEKETGKISKDETNEIKTIKLNNHKLDEQITQLIEELPEIEKQLIIEKDKLDTFTYKKYIAKNEYYSLSRAKKDYRRDHDINYLRKAVHYICSTADRHRYGDKYIAPYPGHPIDENNSPFTPEVTWRMNRIAYGDNSAW
jgi:chromosome segregation ATPase